jgi:CubicO group peptidase (beta-lactamase class C family)
MDPGVTSRIEGYARAHLTREGIAHAVIAFGFPGDWHAFGVGEARIDEPLPIASISKSFTALVVARCGVDLDDQVQRHLPIFPFGDVTIRSVLDHRAGLVVGLDSTPSPLGDVLLLRGTERATNGDFRRSNAGYGALGLLAERVTGRTYGDLVQEHVLGPLGLYGSSGITTESDRPAWATRREWVPTASGAGSALCPIGDLLTFAHAMPTLPAPHALGEDEEDGYRRIGLSGDCPGFGAHAYVCPETGAAFACIYDDTGSTWAIMQLALATLRGDPTPDLYAWEGDPAPTGLRYAAYNPWCPWVSIDLENGTIWFPWGFEPLTPLGDHRYRIGAADGPETLELRDQLDGVAITAIVSGATFHRMA